VLKIEQLASCFDAGYLNLFLLPTEQCNFRCTYCYEDFKVGSMKQDVIRGVKALIASRIPELHTLEISWFGGEPLAAKPVIEEISLHTKQLCAARSVTYTSSITTNGYLLDTVTAEWLSSLGVTFCQVSLDGSPEFHDVTRIRADGSGTFVTIWQNLKAIRQSSLDMKILLRVHFRPDNVESLDSLIEMINEEFSGDSRFWVFFKAVERLGGPNDSFIRTFTSDQKKEIKQRLTQKLKNRSQLYEIVSNEDTYVCYAAKPNSLVIRANGDVAKCTVALYDDTNRIGQLLSNGELRIDQQKMRWWIRGFGSLKESELTCPHGSAPRRLISVETAVGT
jgi:uncharacterized protein